MKAKLFLWIGSACIVVLFMSAGTLLLDDARKHESTDLFEVTMRQVGHALLLASGDKSSRILPVRTIAPYTYEISFESPLSFSPDTLLSIIKHSLQRAELPLEHTLRVVQCTSDAMVYGYQFSPQKPTVPCLGRAQPSDCYLIQVTLPTKNLVDSTYKLVAVFLSGAVLLIAVVGLTLIRKPNDTPVDSPKELLNYTSIGMFLYSPDQSLLKNGEVVTPLSDKESRLLRLLMDNQNEVVSRDKLMKDLWEDEGVFVGRSLDVFISRLRKKLRDDASVQIVSIHGKGYKLVVGNV